MTNRKQDSRKGKRFDKSSKEKKVECFNCGGLTLVSSNCPNLKDIKSLCKLLGLEIEDLLFMEIFFTNHLGL